MHVVLLQNMAYVPAYGGADSSNRMVMEAMSADGHVCEVVAPAYGPNTSVTTESEFRHMLRDRGIEPTSMTDGIITFPLRGVRVHAVMPTDGRNVMAGLGSAVRTVAEAADVLLVSHDDAAQALLEAAHRAAPGRVVSLVHTSTALPFGPMCAAENPVETALLRECAGVLTNTAYMQDYLRTHGDLASTVCAIAPFDPGPHPNFAQPVGGYVTLINPCALKGIDIFLALADRFPETAFAGVPTWGTTAEDRARMSRRENVTVLPAADDVNEIYAQTRVLLMPSLWVETLGRCTTEAMQRGLPVLASDHGGLPEAKCGIEYMLPVNPIASVQTAISDRHRVVPNVPSQDIAPWAVALERLTTDEAHYRDVSERSRAAATAYAEARHPGRVGDYLAQKATTVTASPPKEPEATGAEPFPGSSGPGKGSDEELDDEKRSLLALRALRKADSLTSTLSGDA